MRVLRHEPDPDQRPARRIAHLAFLTVSLVSECRSVRLRRSMTSGTSWPSATRWTARSDEGGSRETPTCMCGYSRPPGRMDWISSLVANWPYRRTVQGPLECPSVGSGWHSTSLRDRRTGSCIRARDVRAKVWSRGGPPSDDLLVTRRARPEWLRCTRRTRDRGRRRSALRDPAVDNGSHQSNAEQRLGRKGACCETAPAVPSQRRLT